jgi:hypothetical protein
MFLCPKNGGIRILHKKLYTSTDFATSRRKTVRLDKKLGGSFDRLNVKGHRKAKTPKQSGGTT